MGKVTVKINRRALKQLERDVATRLEGIETQVNQEMQAVVREVRDEMSGQPVDLVYSELDARLKARIPGIQPTPELRDVAKGISDGELVD